MNKTSTSLNASKRLKSHQKSLKTPKKSKKAKSTTITTRKRTISTRTLPTDVFGLSGDGMVQNGTIKSSFGGLVPTLSPQLTNILTKSIRGMKYVAYNDGVEVIRTNPPKNVNETKKTSTTPPSNSTPSSSTPPPGPDCYDFSNYPAPTAKATNFGQNNLHQQYQQSYQNGQGGPSGQFGSSLKRPIPKTPQIDSNPLYSPMPFHTTNNVLRNSPLLRQLDVDKLFFQTTNFLFIGPRDAQIESVAYLFGQQNEMPVKYLTHKNCSSTLEDIVVNTKDYILWSDVPDIITNTELGSILPSQNFITVFLDYPPSKIRFPNSQTRLNLIKTELIDQGHLDANNPHLLQFKTHRPDPNAPITSDAALNHTNAWQFDGVSDYRILLSDSMSPNEIFDRVQARFSTSDAYITTRGEFTSEKNAATQESIQQRHAEQQEEQENGQFSTFNSLTGETEVVKGIDGVDTYKMKSSRKKKIIKKLPDGREIEVEVDDDEYNSNNNNNFDGNNDAQEGLFELNSFLNAVVSPVASDGGLFLPDLPSPYLLNQHHMFDLTGEGDVLRYPEQVAQKVIEKAQDQFAQDEDPSFKPKKDSKKIHQKKNQNDSDSDVEKSQSLKDDSNRSSDEMSSNDENDPLEVLDELDEDELSPEWAGSVNQMHLFPQSLRRMVELNYLQRLQRIIEGFPFAGIKPVHVSDGLMQQFFSFRNDNVLTTSTFSHLKQANSTPKHQITVKAKITKPDGSEEYQDVVREKNIFDVEKNQAGQPVELPPFPHRPIHFIELYHSDQGVYTDIRTKVSQSLMHSAELFENNMKEQSIRQQKIMSLLQTGNELPESEIHKPPSMYDRLAMISSGSTDFTLSAISTQNSLVPNLILLPIRSKGLIIPRSDTTKSSTHVNRGLLSTAWSPLQYLQLYSSLQGKDPRTVPIGTTYYESRTVQQIAHSRLKKPFTVHLDSPLPNDKVLFPGESQLTRFVKFGTLNQQSFTAMVADISIFTHSYLELVKQGLVQLPPDRSSQAVQEQIKAGMGFNSLYGLNKDEDGGLLNINHYITKISPHIYSHYSPQHLSQWDQPLITPIRPEQQQNPTKPGPFTAPTATATPAQLHPSELNQHNIHTFFKPSVVDVVVPMTDIAMLPAAVMSRDMGTPVRQFIIALDDKHKFLLSLLKDGKIPAISKYKKSDIWHLKREDIVALEKFFYLICGRDNELVPSIVKMLELHYTASLYVHDPNRHHDDRIKKQKLKQEAEVALGTDAVFGKNDAKNDKNNQKSTKSSNLFPDDATTRRNKNLDTTANDTPSKGIVIDVGDIPLDQNDDDGDDAYKNKNKNIKKNVANDASFTVNPVDNKSTIDAAKKELENAINMNENVVKVDQDSENSDENDQNDQNGNVHLKAHQIVPVKRRRRGSDDSDESESSEEVNDDGDDYVNEVTDDASDDTNDDDASDDSEEQGGEGRKKNKKNKLALTDEEVVQFMLQDPEVDADVKKIIEKMIQQDDDEVHDVQPTNEEIDIFQRAFFEKEQEYNEMLRTMPDEDVDGTSLNGNENTDGTISPRRTTIIKQKDQFGNDVEIEVEIPDESTKKTVENDDKNSIIEKKKKLFDKIAPDGMFYPEEEYSADSDSQYEDDGDGSGNWEDNMIMEVDEFILPQEIINTLNTEFITVHVPKRLLHDTIKRSLKENGRILDIGTALSLAASTIDEIAVDNAQLDLDDYYDAVLDHVCELRGDDVKAHRVGRVNMVEHKDKKDIENNNKQKLEDVDVNDIIKQFDGTNGTDNAEKYSQDMDGELQQEVHVELNQNDDDDIVKVKTHYPKMEIPLIIPSLRHPFHDYEQLCEIFGLPHEQPSLKLNNKELAIFVLKQLQSLYAHAMTVAKDENFQLDITNVSNLSNRTRDVILPPPHQGILEMVANVQKFSEKPVRIPFVSPQGETASRYTDMDFVFNDQLMKFLKLKSTGTEPVDNQDSE